MAADGNRARISFATRLFHVFRVGIRNFITDDCLSSAAAIAFYMTVALPPLLVLIFMIGDAVDVSRGTMEIVVREQLGMPTVTQLEGGLSGLASQAQERSGVGDFGWPSKLLGLAVMLASASGVLAHLQTTLNRVWEVQPDPARGGWKQFVLKRLLSLALLIVFAFLLLSSLILTTLLDDILPYVLGKEPTTGGVLFSLVLDNAVAILIATLLFGVAYKILPDATMAWKDVWVGAFLTAVMFTSGKSLLGWWLNRSAGGNAWGAAAASMIALLSWVYYSSVVVLLGAEVTQAWAERYGSGISAEAGAVRQTTHEKSAD